MPMMVPTLQFLLFLSGTLLFMQTLAEAVSFYDLQQADADMVPSVQP